MSSWPLAAGTVATTLRFLTCLSVVHEPEYWTSDVDLPDQFLPRLFDRNRLFEEVGELLKLGLGWPVVSHRDGIVVRSQLVPRYGRNVFMVEATIPATPEQMRDVIWKDGLRIPEWNPTAADVEIVKDFDDSTRMTWQSTKPQVGGLISSRDFVNLNFWRWVPVPLVDVSSTPAEQRFAVEIAYTNATWPTKPPSDRYVRGVNGPSIMVFSPVPGTKPGQTFSRLSWIFNAHMDFSSFIPTRVVNRVIPSSLIEYIQNLRAHVLRKHPS